MPQLNPSEWLEWRENPVTLALREAIKERIDEHTAELRDPDSSRERDIILKGMILAFQKVLEASPADGDLIKEELFKDEI